MSSSKELIEFTEFDFKCDDFFGLFGGILGGTFKLGFEPGTGELDKGRGGRVEGTGGAETDGIDGTDGFSVCLLGLEDGIGGATWGLLPCGLDDGTKGDAPEGIGILGADGGTIPDLLSCLFTDFNFGIPPAKISPN